MLSVFYVKPSRQVAMEDVRGERRAIPALRQKVALAAVLEVQHAVSHCSKSTGLRPRFLELHDQSQSRRESLRQKSSSWAYLHVLLWYHYPVQLLP